ncbi:hypothetical protein BC832DRAFT_126642 [Gaertneriomyces semiglobifer]|nr:hypothetical protein BC832DRAFT_126642 [Gaertneriomyces semiglobifer]
MRRYYQLEDGLIFASIGACVVIFWIVTTVWYLRWWSSPSIRERSPYLTLIGSAFGFLYILFVFLQSSLPSIPCFITIWAQDMGGTAFFVCLYCRIVRQRQEDDMFHQRLMALAKSSQLRKNLSSKAFNQPAWRRLTSIRALRLGRDEKSTASDPEAPPTPVKSDGYNGTMFHIETPNTDEMEVNWYLTRRGAQIDKNVKRIFVTSIGLTGLITLCVQCTTKVHTIWPKVAWLGECPYGWEFLPAWLGLGLFFFVAGPRALWTTRHIVDPHRVRLDLILVQSIGLLGALVGGLWWALFLKTTGIPDYSAGNLFLSSVPIIVQVASVLLPTLRARETDQRRRRQCLLMNYTSFDQVLNDPVMRTELKVFTIRDSCVEAIIFYEEYDKLQRIARTAVQAQFNEEMRMQADVKSYTNLDPTEIEIMGCRPKVRSRCGGGWVSLRPYL